MPNSAITFHELHQDSQVYGSDDEHMVSRVYFSMVINGTDYYNLSVDIKQTVGAISTDPIEVGRPFGYKGPLNYKDFRAGVEAYFRHCIGAGGSGLKIGPGMNARMQGNRIAVPLVYTFDVDEASSEAW